MLLGETEALVWRISSLESHSQPMSEAQTDNTPCRDLPPDLTLPYPGQTTDDSSEWFRVQVTPCLGTHNSLTFDVFSKRSSSYCFHRCTLSEITGAPHIEIRPISSGSFPGDSLTRFSFLSGDVAHMEIEHEGTVRIFSYDAASSFQNDSGTQGVSATVTALEPNMVLWTACVASGRCIYNKYDPDTGEPPTYIVDYL